jgi:hypothetical protein
LLAVAQGGVEDDDAVFGHGAETGVGDAHGAVLKCRLRAEARGAPDAPERDPIGW